MYTMGHRGAAGLAPENTLAAFKAGIEAGADWIELDVHTSSDGQAMVIHDPTTGRTFGKAYVVARTSAADLAKLGLPTLAQAVKVIKGQAKLNIELKSAGCEQAAVKAVQACGYDNAMVSSFSKATLRRVHALDPQVPLAYLQSINVLGFLSQPYLQAVGFRHFLAPTFIVRWAKKRGLMTYAYTVDSPARGLVLAQRGFDALVTNRPDKF